MRSIAMNNFMGGFTGKLVSIKNGSQRVSCLLFVFIKIEEWTFS